MKTLAIAIVATTALSFPALAAPQLQQATRHQAANQQWTSPESLNRQQIRHIQIALNKKGFNAGHVDGIWGPHTRTALRDFQKRHSMQANGRIDNQVLSALGVNASHFASTAQSNQKRPSSKTQPSTVGFGSSEETTNGNSASIDNHSNMNAGSSHQNMSNQGKNTSDQYK
jgi:peptidoglycan hydrolase-like protein with peptidoglycan-binding domain